MPDFKALAQAAQAMADDFQTSEKHHQNYVLVPVAAFEDICSALAAAPATSEEVRQEGRCTECGQIHDIPEHSKCMFCGGEFEIVEVAPSGEMA